MVYFVVKVIISSALIVAVSEFSKKSSFVGSLFASIPLVSVLGMIWLYMETGDTKKIADLSTGIFWLVIPSLPFFLILPQLLQRGMGFYPALFTSLAVMVGLYFGMIEVLARFGVTI